MTGLRSELMPLRTVDPGPPYADLAPVCAMVKKMRVVGLGEATHGTREFFTLKHRIIAALSAETTKVVVAIEADMAAARHLGRYVREASGDPRVGLAALRYWPWYTYELLEFLKWMAQRQVERPGAVEFWGFDSCHITPALRLLDGAIRQCDVDFVGPFSRMRSAIVRLWLWGRTTHALDECGRLVGSIRGRILARAPEYLAIQEPSQFAWTMQAVRLLEQAVMIRWGGGSRERYLAENVTWIESQQPAEALVVLWAHNEHVRRRSDRMGGMLNTTYLDKYFPVALTTARGTYTARGEGALGTYPLAGPSPDSIESYCQQVALPQFALDLRMAMHMARDRQAPRSIRRIGAFPRGDQFVAADVAADYGALVFADCTSPSRPLGPLRLRSRSSLQKYSSGVVAPRDEDTSVRGD